MVLASLARHRAPTTFLLALLAAPLFAAAQPSNQESAAVVSLTVGVTPSPPFSYEEGGEWKGLSVDLWEAVAEQLEIDYSLRPVQLSKAIDGLESGEIDVVAAALVTTGDREAVMDFSHSFYSAGLGIATATTQRSPVFAFVRALFKPETLLAIGALVLVLLIVGFLIWSAEHKRNEEQFGGTAPEGIGSGFWWSAVTMTTVGYGDKAPVTFRGRLIGLLWMFVSLIVVSGFTGAIASALTVNSLAPRVEGLGDLYQARVGAIADSNAADFLEKRGIRLRTYPNTAEGLDAILAGRIDGFVNDLPVLHYHAREIQSRELAVLEQSFKPGFYAFGLRDDLGREEAINQALLDVLGSTRWTEIQQRHLGNVATP